MLAATFLFALGLEKETIASLGPAAGNAVGLTYTV